MNLHGPVRVPESTPTGTATATLSLNTWKGVPVSSTTHVLNILPVKPRPKVEPIAPNLVASLVHPDRQASIATVYFSRDGSRLFTSGYPSGIVQFWDMASKKEVRRIDTPRGYRSFLHYALLTPDWKTLYVPFEKSTVKRFERDGKRRSRIEYSGKIRIWDTSTGKEKAPLLSPPGSAPGYSKLAPNGRYLVCIEHSSYDTSENEFNGVTMVWDLLTGKKSKMHDGYAYPVFSPDGKTAAVTIDDDNLKTSALMLLDFATGKELGKVAGPEKGKFFSLLSFSSDGKLLAVSLGGKKGAPLEIWFLDGKTLQFRGKLSGKADPQRHWGGRGLFTPDAKRFVAVDGEGNILLWDLAGMRLERTLFFEHRAQSLKVSPDGKTLAIGWLPKFDSEGLGLEPDPADLPQPRVTLVDLAGTSRPRLFIAPHGYVGDLAFSPDGKTLAFGGAGAVHLFDLTK